MSMTIVTAIQLSDWLDQASKEFSALKRRYPSPEYVCKLLHHAPNGYNNAHSAIVYRQQKGK
jgi:hypothetical protein